MGSLGNACRIFVEYLDLRNAYGICLEGSPGLALGILALGNTMNIQGNIQGTYSRKYKEIQGHIKKYKEIFTEISRNIQGNMRNEISGNTRNYKDIFKEIQYGDIQGTFRNCLRNYLKRFRKYKDL